MGGGDGGLRFGVDRGCWGSRGGGQVAYGFFSVFLQAVKGLSVVEEVGAEGLNSFVGFFLLAGDELPFGHLGVVIDGSGEGC